MSCNRNWTWVVAIGLFAGLVTVGCNQPTATTNSENVTKASFAAKSDGGCCQGAAKSSCCAGEEGVAGDQDITCEDCNACAEGDSANCKCDHDASANVAEVSTKGTSDCCGKCGGASKGKTAGNQAKGGCCGKCGGEQTVAAKAESGCGNCKACAESDESNCKCDQEPVEGTSTDKPVSSHAQDRDTFHFLLQNHEKLSREVKELDNGVETLTESSDPEIVEKLQEHVAAMYSRVEDGRRLRMWDTLYQEVFKHADKIEMKLENTTNGIKVTETSDDEYVVKLIQAHAKVVSGFVEHGFDEARKNHEAPK